MLFLRDPGLVSQLIIHAFTGLPGLCPIVYHVCIHRRPWLCFTNPQEMFYCVSYVSSQEILALFECVLCMLGKHFTD